MSDIVLKINTNFGEFLELNVKTTDTISMVKGVVYNFWNMPPERQVLLMHDNLLLNSATLADHGIYQDTSVDIRFLMP